jgi:hypothetical protein
VCFLALAEKLSIALERRPSIDELEKAGVVGAHELRDEEAPLITHAKTKLEEQISSDHKPDIDSLKRTNILPFAGQ